MKTFMPSPLRLLQGPWFQGALLFGLFASPALATTYNINTTNVDLVDDGKCSLAEAVQAINTLLAVNTNDCPAGTETNNNINIPSGTFTSPTVYKATRVLRLRRSVSIVGGGMDKTIIAADFPLDTELFFFDGGLRPPISTTA